MKHINLSVPDREYSFVMKLLKRFPFVRVTEPEHAEISDKNQKFLNELKETVVEVNKARQGTIKLKSANQLLDEL